MKKPFILFMLCLIPFLSVGSLFCKPRVSPRNNYERIIAIVPMIGAGTAEDPRRPMFSPAQGVAANRRGLIAFSYQLSDDENFALVEFVGVNSAAFKDILAESKNGLRIFQKGKFNKADLAAAWGQYKREFDLENLGVSLP